MTLIKICGITNKPDALEAAALGVDMLGFVFFKGSKRYVKPSVAQDITNELPDKIEKVGVFVDEKESDVMAIAEDAGLTALQFHGDESPEYCAKFSGRFKVIKAFRVKTQADLKAVNAYASDYYLFDSYQKDTEGGTGRVFDWKILNDFEILRPMVLSGGLNHLNVGRAIIELAPFAVDASSGLEEKPGKKDHFLMKIFVENVRGAG